MVTVSAPMPGNVFKINVAVGDQVNLYDEVVILESMKMEVPVCAPEAGKVAEIKVKPGNSVNPGDVMLVIE